MNKILANALLFVIGGLGWLTLGFILHACLVGELYHFGPPDMQPPIIGEEPFKKLFKCPICDGSAELKTIAAHTVWYACKEHHTTAVNRENGRIVECRKTLILEDDNIVSKLAELRRKYYHPE